MRDHFDGQQRRSDPCLAVAMNGSGSDHITETSMEGQVGRIEPAHQLGASIVAEKENGIALKVGDLEVPAKAFYDCVQELTDQDLRVGELRLGHERGIAGDVDKYEPAARTVILGGIRYEGRLAWSLLCIHLAWAADQPRSRGG